MSLHQLYSLIFSTLVLILSPQVSSFEVTCRYDIETGFEGLVPSAYCCNVISDHHQHKHGLLTITSATGQHKFGKKDSDVTGFWVYGKHFDFFPQGLDKVFGNLEVIIFGECGMKTIGINDLKPFPKLIWFSLFVNQLEVVEDGLFDYNPNLKYISLRDNKISRIVPDSFDHLTNLVTLRLAGNLCINLNANENRDKVLALIREMKLKCPAPIVTTSYVDSAEAIEESFDDERSYGGAAGLHTRTYLIVFVAVFYSLSF